ncbi:MAG: tetratricopeptide repeat protein [Silicimonas sp.]|nr:tetratricopeptide repeat protein [Silicimonas sp.]
MKCVALCLLPFLATAALADCPASPDIAAQETALLDQARAAENELAAQPIRQALWRLWATAPDEAAQALLDRGMAARSSYDFLGAIRAFDRLVEYCPEYAEGYNQRAFVNFLREDFDAALPDLDRALERSPRHVAALSGKALTLMGLGRADEAQEVLREAVKLNPWIPERGLLTVPLGEEL